MLSLDVTALEKWVLAAKERDTAEYLRARREVAKHLARAQEAATKRLTTRDHSRVSEVLTRLEQLEGRLAADGFHVASGQLLSSG